jgi:hypothetical protein
VINFPNGKMLGGLTTQGLLEMTLREEFVKMNELTRTITLSSGIQMRVVVKRMVDGQSGMHHGMELQLGGQSSNGIVTV